MPEVSNWREALFCGHFGPVSSFWCSQFSFMTQFVVSDWRRCHLHCYACSEPPGSTGKPTRITRRSTCHCSSTHRLFCRSGFYTYSYVELLPFSRSPAHTCMFEDGLSIPFFSIGRHTLTISRSIVDQPDWLLGVRRAPPQEDPERIATKGTNTSVDIAEEPLREGQQRVEWSDLLNLSDSAPDGVVTRKKILRIDDVCTAVYLWMSSL